MPRIHARIEMQRGNPTGAVQLLEATRPYEGGLLRLRCSYLRGQAYLNQKKGAEAAAEFQKILDHRGWWPIASMYPLAHLGLARAAGLTGDTAKARKGYQDFLALWRDADPDIPILREAKQEYGRLK